MRLPFFIARRFVAGEDFSQTAPKVRELNDKGIAVTLDLLGENVTDRSMAEETTRSYCKLLDEINEAGLDATISVKLTMMGLDIDPQYCRDNLFTLLEQSRKHGQFVRIDMEGSAYTQQTLDIYHEAKEQFGDHVGIVIQAYLHRTREDIDKLAELNADVRLCKGAYKEASQIAYQNMADIRAVFKEYAARLIASTPFTRIATHDDQLIEWTRKHISENNIPKERIEFQMLYGLRLNTCEQLVSEGYKVRVYVPYGVMWLPYFSRRLRERKENIWFILSNLFKK
ncbi:proline dehydrogenase family protein [Balneolales bacterium ANBcel1]|nr:proline dehydrogenase family protein [Balneolales bacterium ANBcel1]